MTDNTLEQSYRSTHNSGALSRSFVPKSGKKDGSFTQTLRRTKR